MRNEKDLEDVPDEVSQHMQFVFAERVEDVLEAALVNGQPQPLPDRRPGDGKLRERG